MIVSLLWSATACQLIRDPQPWTFTHVPAVNDLVVVPQGGVICTSLSGAQFMSATGFFSPDCVSEIPDTSKARVEDIVYHELNGVSMRIVMTTINATRYWIPLPDHNWS